MKYLATIMLVFLYAVSDGHAATPAAFRWQQPVQLPQLAREEKAAIPLDTPFYEVAQSNWSDLRLFDDQAREVPYLVEKCSAVETVTVRIPSPAKLISLNALPDNRIEVIFQLEKEDTPWPDGLTLVTPLKNFEHQVAASGSADGKTWLPLVQDVVIFDYTRFMDIANRDVHLPGNSHRWFKLEIDRITDERRSPLLELTRNLQDGRELSQIRKTTLEDRPFRIDRVDFWHQVQRESVRKDRKRNYPVAAFTVSRDDKKKLTLVEITMQREPVTGFSVITASRNFSRQMTVEKAVAYGDTERRDWVALATGTITKLQFQGVNREELKVSFAEQRESRYRLVIRDGDNPALDISGVSAEGNLYQVLFLADPARAYRLLYGAAEIACPVYDMGTVLAELGGVSTAGSQTGPHTANPDYREGSWWAGKGFNNPLVFGIAIAVMVVVLGWGLFRAMRQLEPNPPADEK